MDRALSTGTGGRFEVSVIIPTFNRAYCLAEAIDSVLAQTFGEFELIVVDDGSTDDTPGLASRYPSARWVRQERNGGVSRARNVGIRLARAPLVCFLDSDDLWVSTKLEKQVDWMVRHPDCLVCYTDEIWIRGGVRVNPMNKHRKYTGDIFRSCLPLCRVSPSSVMIRAEVFDRVGMFDESLPACEDYDLWLRMAARFPFHLIEEKLILKRGGHEDQLSRKYWGMDRFRVQALAGLIDSGAVVGDRLDWTVETLAEKCRVLALGGEKRGEFERAEYFRDLARRYVNRKWGEDLETARRMGGK
ncbi:MAG: glycosyl transferase [Nitrospinae bacterium CG11_big_fil_rev_8_21_14_0_20_56_8]|nr:MAG: glycosyl transferase [Nitrospinae bacterium CG11_big_fil_rev_8_21_14_0_20_56_8]